MTVGDAPWANVPDGWEVQPLLAMADEGQVRNTGMAETNLLSLSYGRIVRKDIEGLDGLLPTSFETYQIVEPGDVVCRFTDLQNDKRSLRTGLVTERGIITSAYTALKPRCLPRWMSYLLRAYDYQKVFYGFGGGVRQSLKFADVKRLPILVPPEPEQRVIADFLDQETAQIDAMVDAQERLVALLEQRRAAAITEEVTGQGLSLPAKETQSPFIREIPESWSVAALKRYWTVTDCKHLTAEFVEEEHEGFPLASIGEVKGSVVDLSLAKRTTRHFFDLLREGGRDPRPGDLIFSRNASVGNVARVTPEHPEFAMGQDVCLLRPLHLQNASPRFVQYALQAQPIVAQMELDMVGSTFRRINVDDIRAFLLPWPATVADQERIADRLDRLVRRIDAMIAQAQKSIALMKERRAAVISAAVTGRIDVRTGIEQVERDLEEARV